MTEFAKMDVFFLVTTIVVIVLGILVAFVLYRVWQILGHVERISGEIDKETVLVRRDIAELRENVSSKGMRLRYLIRFFKGSLGELFRGDKQ